MGKTITSLNGLQRDRNTPDIPKIVMNDKNVSPVKEANVSPGRSSIGTVQTILMVLLFILNIALVINLKTHTSETEKLSAQIRAMDKDIRTQIAASADEAKKIDIMHKAQIDELSKTTSALYSKFNSLEESLKIDRRPETVDQRP